MTKRRNNIKRNRFSILFPVLTIIGIGIIAVLSSGYEKSWTYNWNDIRKEIKDSIQVAKEQGITSGFVGVGARSTEDEIQRRKWIMKNATELELLKLTKYPNGNVKAIAYEGLIKKETYKEKAELISKAIADNEYLVDYQSGCVGVRYQISEYLMMYVLNFDRTFPPSPLMVNNYGLSDLEKEKILTEFHNRKK
ncbi:hypothetical protein KFZ70_15140 [Tamlana fucoidanivorans]|uniref:Uncharacterized protein n=1 Tax=Allotamlana fucoidanivorans TaxID=2583814 RepID=A0A5C4SBP3_9FLAO|nr:hypothetical protein [Tamlana fucoidanivorans]TNJ40701.1 hypothetical protein FGF67_16835 [Tamlana fucoidanivorans]